ncbi:hypothetical protein HYV88_03885 [Candidatus Woesearchaeota archaeon]|nr:hypothetical protein [Candidatus Woesearchaeota archaeon]
MVNTFRKIILLGLILIVVHAFIFLSFDFNSYFIFALLSILVYAILISDEIKKKEKNNLEHNLIKQREIDDLLRERIEKQSKLLKLYRKRLDQLYIELAEKSKKITEEKGPLGNKGNPLSTQLGKELRERWASYFGSDKNRTYHKENCRFGKRIKQKDRIFSENAGFFKKKKFKACKVCMKKL